MKVETEGKWEKRMAHNLLSELPLQACVSQGSHKNT